MSELGISNFEDSTGRTIRTTDRTSSAPDRDEDQTDRLENQKVREVSEKNQMFILLDLEEERTVLWFEQKVLDEELADLLQNHPSRFSNLANRLLERKVRDPILQDLEEEQKNRF
jgi:hypothetical protein